MVGQLLGSYRLVGFGCLTVEADEVLDAQAIDVGVVRDTLQGKVLAEIGAIDADVQGKLRKGNVVLQIELLFLAILLQQWPDVLGQAKILCRAVANG